MYFDHRRSPSDSDHTPLTRAPREGQGPSNSICQHQIDISPIFDQINAILYRSKSYDTCLSYIPAWFKNVIRGRVHVTVRRTGLRN